MHSSTLDHESMPGIEAKLHFLRDAASHAGCHGEVGCTETHMSWLFFVDQHVLKLKKPVRYPFLDFSTLAARAFYCREELHLNSRLAPGVYLGLLALQYADGGFALVPEAQLPASGQTVDWLVWMRRLPEQRMLDRLIAERDVAPADMAALASVLAAFYRRVSAVDVAAPEYLARFQRELAADREVLLRPQFELHDVSPALARMDAALTRHADLLSQRAEAGHVVDGHGDLRPEHVCLLQPPVIIDCLEFNARLRQVDPFDELAFLALECEMAGAAWIGPQLTSRCAAALGDVPGPALMQLYTAHRALLRARLAMAHLLDPQPRTPAKWPPLAQAYVERALAALDALDDAADLSRALGRSGAG